MLRSTSFHLLALWAVLAQAEPLHAQLQLDPPGETEFIADHANLINDDDREYLRNLADRLLTDTAVPLIVVTIQNKARHGGGASGRW